MGKYTAAGGSGGASVDDASATTKGIIEVATNAEVQTGTDTARAITPAGLQACTGTTTRKGVLELATNAEVQTGTDTARPITPAGLQACTGTTTRAGVLELATDAEAKAGTDTARAITAANLRAKVNELIVVGNATKTLSAAETGSIVYLDHANSAANLPDACAAGTHFTIINNTGAQETIGLNSNGVLVTGLPNAAISDHLSKTFICVDLTGSASTWAVIG